MAKGDPMVVQLVCQVVNRHENDNPTDQIQTTQYLPESATRLDTQMATASNVEELFINASHFQRNRSRENSNSRRSPAKVNAGSNSKQQGQSQKRYWRSPGGRAWSLSRTFSRGQSPSGNQGRPKSPTPQGRNGSRQRFTSKHGRRYSKSPGGNSWRISSRSPTPRPGGTQQTRGRTGHPSSSTVTCIRCGGVS